MRANPIPSVCAPVQPTTRAGTHPTTYAALAHLGAADTTFTSDPAAGNSIEAGGYAPDTLECSRRRAATAIRACAKSARVGARPPTQVAGPGGGR